MNTLELNGFQMSYEKWGEGTATVVLIHGNLASKRWWNEIAHDLAKDFTVFAVDLRGCGRSSKPQEGYSIPQYAHDVAVFLEKMGIASCCLVGHSLGGAVAMGIASQHPERVEKLILLNSAPVSGFFTPPDKAEIVKQYANNLDLLKLALSAVVPLAVHKPIFSVIVEDAWTAVHTSIPNMISLAEIDYTNWATTFNKPVLILYGEKDVLISRENMMQTAKAFSNRAIITHPEAGHSPQVEVPEWFVQQVRQFLHL